MADRSPSKGRFATGGCRPCRLDAACMHATGRSVRVQPRKALSQPTLAHNT